jgi:hypothetical protein
LIKSGNAGKARSTLRHSENQKLNRLFLETIFRNQAAPNIAASDFDEARRSRDGPFQFR